MTLDVNTGQMIDATKQAFDDGCAGVITHGTDNLHVTSAAMFYLSGEGKAPPGRIALVGSSDRQISSSDATENLIPSILGC